MELMFSNTTLVTEEEIEKLNAFNGNELKKIKRTHQTFYLILLVILAALFAFALIKIKTNVSTAVPLGLFIFMGINFILVQAKYSKIEQINKTYNETGKLKVDFFDEKIAVTKETETFELTYKDIIQIWGNSKNYYIYTKNLLLPLVQTKFNKGRKDDFIPFLEKRSGKNKYINIEEFDLD